MCFGGGGAADDIAQEQRRDEEARQRRIRQGMTQIAATFGKFNDDFYKKRYDDYMGYALPDIDRQQAQQRRDLIYALARTGNLDSSAATDKSAELTEEGNKQLLNASNEGLNQENALRSQVEQTRGNVVAELNATGDNQAASQSAMRAVQNLNQPAGFSPLGNLFLNFAQSIAQIGSRAANGYSGFMGGGSGASLFGPGGGSQRVVGA
jgi:hypothetical protein